MKKEEEEVITGSGPCPLSSLKTGKIVYELICG